MLAKDPANSFARYGLAMEYVNSGELDFGVSEFERVIEANPDYVAAYFHGGQALEKLGRLEDARAIYGFTLSLRMRPRVILSVHVPNG